MAVFAFLRKDVNDGLFNEILCMDRLAVSGVLEGRRRTTSRLPIITHWCYALGM